MTDSELLELAAKAQGYKYMNGALWDGRDVVDYGWNPFEDDGQALRLAVKLNIDLSHSWVVVSGADHYPMASIHAHFNSIESYYELKEADPYAAARRAIVNVAAELGKELK